MVTAYRGNQSSNVPNLMRGRSPFLWATFPVEDIQRNNNKGWFDGDDFLRPTNVAAGASASYGDYIGFADTGGLVAEADEIGGVRNFSSDGDNEGASIRRASQPFQIAQGQGRLVFECRIKKSTIADTKNGVFIGLAETLTLSATVPIAAAGTIADQNLVGFWFLEGDGDQVDFVYKANGVTLVDVAADMIPSPFLVADTYVKLGFTFDQGTFLLQPYVNGIAIGSGYTVVSAAGTDFPNDVRLGFIAALLNATGTTPGSMSLDWWYCGQLAV